jgi:O-antigen/teichoic acid export membrane protein
LTLLAGRPLLTRLYRREYADNVGLLALLVGPAGLTTVFCVLIGGLTAARRFRDQIQIHLTAVLIAIVGSGLLVPRYGLLGAGVPMLISAVAAVLSAVWVMHAVLGTELTKQCLEEKCRRTRFHFVDLSLSPARGGFAYGTFWG